MHLTGQKMGRLTENLTNCFYIYLTVIRSHPLEKYPFIFWRDLTTHPADSFIVWTYNYFPIHWL